MFSKNPAAEPPRYGKVTKLEVLFSRTTWFFGHRRPLEVRAALLEEAEIIQIGDRS
jgi:hypothetical protein